jgi:hypothetical protein
MERRRFRSRLGLLLRRRRRVGGVILRLLLRVSRRPSRSKLLRRVLATIMSSSWVGVSALSLLRDNLLRGVRLKDRDADKDLDLELEVRLRRDLGGGEALMDSEVGRFSLDGRGERDRDVSEGGDDHRGLVRRSGLLPLPLPSPPL